MYRSIHTLNDVLKEKYSFGAELTEFGFPKLVPVRAELGHLRPVPFQSASKERNPKKCIVHFFLDDYKFERLWNNCEKYLGILQNFKYVCGPDFSFYSDMPYVMQLWNVYRNRALSHFMTAMGMDVIPTVGWADEKSFEFCFDGLPEESTLAVSTNGCFSESGKACFRAGFSEMCRRLHPYNVLVIGKEIEVEDTVEIVYLDSFGQEMTKRLEKKDGEPQRNQEYTK